MGGGTGKFAPEAGKARMRTAFFTRRFGHLMTRDSLTSKATTHAVNILDTVGSDTLK